MQRHQHSLRLPNRVATVSFVLIVVFLAVSLLHHSPDALTRSWNKADYAASVQIPPLNCAERPFTSPNEPEGNRARRLSAQELLCRPINSRAAGVPKLFHQSWKTTDLPAKFRQWSASCREHHPDWEWVLWTDEDNLQLVRTYFPWLEETYISLPGPIYRADLARNLYMYMFGGVYADLDTDCVRSTADVPAPYRFPIVDANNTTTDAKYKPIAAFGRMGTDATFEHSIPNAWMAASPLHPFFLLPLESAKREMQNSRRFMHQLWYISPSAEQLTGPVALRESILRWNQMKGADGEVLLLPPDLIYPFNWKTDSKGLGAICSAEMKTFNETECKKALDVDQKGTISVTYWSHTHSGKTSNSKNIKQISQET